MDNQRIWFGFALVLCIYSNLTNTQTINTNLVTTRDSFRSISVGSEQFALDLFKRISVGVAPHAYDFMISPFSIWSLLILVTEGAEGNTLTELQRALRLTNDISQLRDTYQQIQKALCLNTSTNELAAIQGLFADVNRPIYPKYQSLLEHTYGANVVQVNFGQTHEAQKLINSYVERVTRGEIDYVVDENDLKDAQMVLLSAIFFKGQWKYPFNTSLTRPESFYDEDGKVVGSVNMMMQEGIFPATVITELDSHILELPYGKDERLSMIIILPKKGTPLTNVIERLSTYGTSRIINELQKATNEHYDETNEVEVSLPRFTITTDLVLNTVLEQMGVLDLFDSKNANLSKLSNYPIYLSRVFHKTTIRVNEEGTTASAATSGILVNKATKVHFMLNRPFAYIIVEKTTNSLLFCGQVRNPGIV